MRWSGSPPTRCLVSPASLVAGPAGGRSSRVRRLVDAVVAHRDTIDAEIVRAAPQYPVGGLAPMDRSLLRCAIGEVLHSPTPARVAIAEWVELARTYSGDPMRRLMNGVLGRIAKESNDLQASAPSSEEGVRGNDL